MICDKNKGGREEHGRPHSATDIDGVAVLVRSMTHQVQVEVQISPAPNVRRNSDYADKYFGLVFTI